MFPLGIYSHFSEVQGGSSMPGDLTYCTKQITTDNSTLVNIWHWREWLPLGQCDCEQGSDGSLEIRPAFSKYLKVHLYFSVTEALYELWRERGEKTCHIKLYHGYKTRLSKNCFLFVAAKCSYSQLGFQNQSSQRIYINTVLRSILLFSLNRSDTQHTCEVAKWHRHCSRACINQHFA